MGCALREGEGVRGRGWGGEGKGGWLVVGRDDESGVGLRKGWRGDHLFVLGSGQDNHELKGCVRFTP